jgi:hypothetical protein
VSNLTEADLAIFEQGQRQVISHFASGHVPIDMSFLLDTSGSIQSNLSLAQKAAPALVQQLHDRSRGCRRIWLDRFVSPVDDAGFGARRRGAPINAGNR